MTILIIAIVEFILICVLTYIIRNLWKIRVVYEEWINDFSKTIKKLDTELDELDSAGTFRSDDEVGYFYQGMYSILKRLRDYNVIDSDMDTEEQENAFYEGSQERFKRIRDRNRQDIEIEEIQQLNRKDYVSKKA